MSRDEIEAWLRRVYAVRAAGDVASAMAMMGPDTTYRMAGDAGTSPIPAVAQRGAALGAMLEAMCAAMPARSLELARVIVDGDTGYGSVPNVIRTVREFERAGAAGMLLEDQVFPKRCGHFTGKQVISVEEMETKLKAALDARLDPDFVLIARTDARAVEGLDAAINRAHRYAAIGADMIFVEAPQSVEELTRIAREIEKPQLANMLVGGVTPILSADELERLGFKIVVSPVESLAIAAFAVEQLARAMLDDGRVDGLSDRMCSFAEIKRLLGAEELVAQAARLS